MKRLARISFAFVTALSLLGSPAYGRVEYLSIPTPYKAALTARYPDNCVFFLRNDLKVRLPTGLTYWSAKLKLINVKGSPRDGDVAMIEVSGTYRENGHVAMVDNVTKTSITIIEANYKAGRVTMRRATGRDLADAASQLNIRGYYRPR